jgi:hypothetical protein
MTEGWTIELEKAEPETAPAYWHCRIYNDDLGFTSANDGDTPEQAVLRAQLCICRQIRKEVSELLQAMDAVLEIRAATP